MLYSSNSLTADSLSESADSTKANLSPSSLNLGKTDLRAYLGNFLDLTVLIRSGKSKLLSFFMVWMKLLCWAYLKIANDFVNSSIVLTTSELVLVNFSQST